MPSRPVGHVLTSDSRLPFQHKCGRWQDVTVGLFADFLDGTRDLEESGPQQEGAYKAMYSSAFLHGPLIHTAVSGKRS